MKIQEMIRINPQLDTFNLVVKCLFFEKKDSFFLPYRFIWCILKITPLYMWLLVLGIKRIWG